MDLLREGVDEGVVSKSCFQPGRQNDAGSIAGERKKSKGGPIGELAPFSVYGSALSGVGGGERGKRSRLKVARPGSASEEERWTVVECRSGDWAHGWGSGSSWPHWRPQERRAPRPPWGRSASPPRPARRHRCRSSAAWPPSTASGTTRRP